MPRNYTHKERTNRGLFLSLGAGVQSSTLAEMFVEGDLSAAPLDAVIFADTGDEPDYVYGQVEYLRERLMTVNTRLEIVSTGNLIESVVSGGGRLVTMPLWVMGKNGKAAMLRRQCTKEFKIMAIQDFILNWLVERGYAKGVVQKRGIRRRVNPGVQITEIIGISLDEFERACQSERDPNWIKLDYPLIEKKMRRDDCIAYLQAKNLPVPKKSSCRVCPFHDDIYWLALSPSDFAHAVSFDHWLRSEDGIARLRLSGLAYLHRSLTPLNKVVFSHKKSDVLPCVHCMT